MKLMCYLLILILIGCTEDVKKDNELYSTWELHRIEEINDQGLVTSSSESEDWNCSITLEFLDNGTIKIITCRNELVGRYIKEHDTLEILDIGGTKVNEDEIGDTFLSHLNNASSYVLDENTLTISGNNFNLSFKLMES